jgi:hypothetical protein
MILQVVPGEFKEQPLEKPHHQAEDITGAFIIGIEHIYFGKELPRNS